VARGFLARLSGRHDKEMPFLEHLEELRQVILASLAAIVICAAGCYVFSGRLLDYIVVENVGEAQFLRPMEAFSVRFKLALILGTVVSLPFVSFQIWSFIVPGLLGHERRTVLPLVIASTILFLGGMAFSYFVLTPIMLQMLVGFGTEHVRPNITVDYLLDFIMKMAVGAGLLFQFPLVVVILTLLRVMSPRQIWSRWRHAIVVILIVSAVVTPGDGPSQLVLAAPIVLLFFLSATVASLIDMARRRKEGNSA